jgi:hypothetical protein
MNIFFQAGDRQRIHTNCYISFINPIRHRFPTSTANSFFKRIKQGRMQLTVANPARRNQTPRLGLLEKWAFNDENDGLAGVRVTRPSALHRREQVTVANVAVV